LLTTLRDRDFGLLWASGALDNTSRWMDTVAMGVGNQQKWDTLVKERSGRNGSVVGLPEQVVVALSSG